MIKEGYANKKFMLVDSEGSEMNIGDRVATPRKEESKIVGGYPPHKVSSAGFVNTHLGSHYAHVYGLRWREINDN